MSQFDIPALCRFSNSFELILKEPPEFAYHYTSKDAAKNIITGNTLRFTDRYFLNDYSEGKYVFELCLNHLEDLMPKSILRGVFTRRLSERIKNGQTNQFYVYQCSMTKDHDSLCMWNYYTNQDTIRGYNLKFNTKNILQAIRPTTASEDCRIPMYARMVIYNINEQLEILKELLSRFVQFADEFDPDNRHSNIIAAIMIDKLSDQGVFFKKDCFSIENEFRVAISTYVNEDEEFVAISEERKIMRKHGLEIPYVDIPFDKNALVGITLSPTFEFDAEREYVLGLLADNGYTKCGRDAISTSDIPVRF